MPPPPISRSIRPLTAWRAIKDQAIAASGVTGWTLHDIRRSFATALGEYQRQDNETKMAESVIDAILNHRQSVTRAGVMGSYQRSTRWPEQTIAMKQWGAILSAAIDAAKAQQPSAGPADATE